MLYSVKEVSSMSNVTIKTLHHYHKIGLLMPAEITEAGYRLYGKKELERLQQIMFYRELDFPLEQIKTLLKDEPERLTILRHQEELLLLRQQRLMTIIHTLRSSIKKMEEGKPMSNQEMFKGFSNEEEWNAALSDHNQHLKDTYGIELPEVTQGNVQELNDQAKEAATFMAAMADSLRAQVKHTDGRIHHLIRSHLDFLNEHGHSISPTAFAAQTKFFLNDDFHLQMLEGQQTGLAYYLSAAAESFASVE